MSHVPVSVLCLPMIKLSTAIQKKSPLVFMGVKFGLSH